MINWRELIIDLNRAGFSCAEIGRKLNTPSSTILGIKNEEWREPAYSLGAAIIALHDKVKAAGLMKEAA